MDNNKLQMLADGFFRRWKALDAKVRATARCFLAAANQCVDIADFYDLTRFIHEMLDGILARETEMVAEYFADIRQGCAFVSALVASAVA